MFTGNFGSAAFAAEKVVVIGKAPDSPAVAGYLSLAREGGRLNPSSPAKAGDSIREHSIRVVKLSSVSTGLLNALLHVHVRPINLVVFQGTFGLNPTKPDLGAGFTLICFQRLSVPFIAIQPCR